MMVGTAEGNAVGVAVVGSNVGVVVGMAVGAHVGTATGDNVVGVDVGATEVGCSVGGGRQSTPRSYAPLAVEYPSTTTQYSPRGRTVLSELALTVCIPHGPQSSHVETMEPTELLTRL